MTWTPEQQQDLLRIIQRRNERDRLRQQQTQTSIELEKLRQQQANLRSQWENEQADVDRLNRLSWASVYYSLLDQKEKQISQEEAEARQAQLRYDAVTAALTNIQQQLESQQIRLTDYESIDADYKQLTATKRVLLTNSLSNAYQPYKQQLASLTASNLLMQELEEAHAAGLRALDEVIPLNRLLNQARNLGTWDMLGGSTLSSVMKYNKLDAVREQSYRVTHTLQQFRAEYADLNRSFMADWQFDQGATRFVDIFFDNIFTDAAVQSRIRQAHETAQTLEYGLVSAIETLKNQMDQAVEQNRWEADKLQLLLEKS